MARIDTLGNFLTDVATAIRNKKGTTDTIVASDFDTEIESIETGGSSTITKGIIINECDENGYATDVSVVGMTSIPDYYFAAYSSAYVNALNKYVTNIRLPNDLTSIGNNAFDECGNLALTELPSGVTSIGNSAFSGCSHLVLTSLPSGLTSIEGNTFRNCSHLVLTSLPSGVTSIGTYAFFMCVNLVEMTCLGNITSIEDDVFNYCARLSKFALPNTTSVPTLKSTSAFSNTPIASRKGYIYVPDDLVESFKSATNWSTYANQIKAISEMEASA